MSEQHRRRSGDQSQNGESLEVRFARLEQRMIPVEEGVANFRAFSTGMTAKVDSLTAMMEREFREAKIRDEEKIKAERAVKQALHEQQELEASEKEAREKKADRNWSRILRWVKIAAAIVGLIVTVENITGPTIRHWLHQHGWNIVEAEDGTTKADTQPQDAVIPALRSDN